MRVGTGQIQWITEDPGQQYDVISEGTSTNSTGARPLGTQSHQRLYFVSENPGAKAEWYSSESSNIPGIQFTAVKPPAVATCSPVKDDGTSQAALSSVRRSRSQYDWRADAYSYERELIKRHFRYNRSPSENDGEPSDDEWDARIRSDKQTEVKQSADPDVEDDPDHSDSTCPAPAKRRHELPIFETAEKEMSKQHKKPAISRKKIRGTAPRPSTDTDQNRPDVESSGSPSSSPAAKRVYQTWTPEDLNALAASYIAGMSLNDLSQIIHGRSLQAINARIVRLKRDKKLVKSEDGEWMYSP